MIYTFTNDYVYLPIGFKQTNITIEGNKIIHIGSSILGTEIKLSPNFVLLFLVLLIYMLIFVNQVKQQKKI